MDWPQFYWDNYDNLTQKWGLIGSFAERIVYMFYFLTYYGIRYTVTSGYRSPAKQKELLDRWKRGDPSIVAKPATNSRHLTGEAIDITCGDYNALGFFAKHLGLRWGGDFSKPDVIHVDTG